MSDSNWCMLPLNETISSYKFENDLFGKIIYKNALFSKNGL